MRTIVLDSMIFRSLLLVVVLAPLPFGAVHPWAWSALGVITGSLLVAWSVSRTFDRHPPEVELRVTTPFLVSVTLVVAWVGLQWWPGPPLAWRHPLWQPAAAALGAPAYGSVGLDPASTVSGLLRLLTDGGIFWLAVQYGRNPQRAHQAITVLAFATAAVALYGVAVYLLGSTTILWFAKEAYGGDLTATFVNRNSYATYAGLGWLCQLALFFRGLNNHTRSDRGVVDWLGDVLTYLERGGWPYSVAAILSVSALLGSHSRGGLIASSVGVATLCLALVANRSHERAAARRFSYFTAALLTVCLLAGGRPVEERLSAAAADGDDRARVYAQTIEAIIDRPFLGTGLGTFEAVFRLHRTPEITVTFAQAHNSYLEAALELGIPACVLLFAGIAAVALFTLWGAFHRRRDTVYPCLGLAATALVALHSAVDFSLQIPAVAATYALIMGIAFAQSWSTRPHLSGRHGVDQPLPSQPAGSP